MFGRAAQPRKRIGTPMAGGCLSLFGLPFLLAGLFMTGLYFSGYVKWWQAQSWQEVPCWIESSELETSRGESTSHRAMASYRYQFGERDYTGDRVSFHGGSDNIGSFQQDAYREISAHENASRAFRCFVNPDQPSESVLYRPLRWPMQVFLSIFALTFPAVGAGLVVGGLLGMREARRLEAIRQAHPGERWKWNSGWTGSSIPVSATPVGKWLFAYTVWFWLIVAPLILAMIASDAFVQDKTAPLVLILVGIGLIPTFLAMRRIRHWQQVGRANFEPKQWPASPGSELRGDLVIERQPAVRGDMELTLSCEKSVTHGSGEDSRTVTESIWSEQKAVPLDTITRDIGGYRIPVAFHLPARLPESTIEGLDAAKFHWKLSLKFPGSAIRSDFEIPVFQTAPRPDVPLGAAEEVVPVEIPAEDLPRRLSRCRIEATFDSAGRPLFIHCPPARHRSVIGFVVLFNLIWTAVAVFLIQQNAPLIFQVVWPLSATAIWASVLWMCLHQRTVVFDSSRLVVTHRFSVLVWTRTYSKQDIVGLSHDSNMSSGNQNYYRVRLESVIGKKETLVDGINEATTAMGLVSSLGKWRQSAA